MAVHTTEFREFHVMKVSVAKPIFRWFSTQPRPDSQSWHFCKLQGLSRWIVKFQCIWLAQQVILIPLDNLSTVGLILLPQCQCKQRDFSMEYVFVAVSHLDFMFILKSLASWHSGVYFLHIKHEHIRKIHIVVVRDGPKCPNKNWITIISVWYLLLLFDNIMTWTIFRFI